MIIKMYAFESLNHWMNFNIIFIEISNRIWDPMAPTATVMNHQTALRPTKMVWAATLVADRPNGFHPKAFQFCYDMKLMPMAIGHSVTIYQQRTQFQTTFSSRSKRIALRQPIELQRVYPMNINARSQAQQWKLISDYFVCELMTNNLLQG